MDAATLIVWACSVGSSSALLWAFARMQRRVRIVRRLIEAREEYARGEVR
jgi:hypothetical protein